MNEYENKEYKIFELFHKNWALVTAGTPEHFNSCTIGWGSMGTIWNRPIVTVYVHPSRYTSEFLKNSDTFTVSFYPESCRKALGYMGSHSGRNEDKAKNCGLTPAAFGSSVTYEEASFTLLCKKLYQHPMLKEELAPEIWDHYDEAKKSFPDGNGGWEPHLVFAGEIIDCLDKTK